MKGLHKAALITLTFQKRRTAMNYPQWDGSKAKFPKVFFKSPQRENAIHDSRLPEAVEQPCSLGMRQWN